MLHQPKRKFNAAHIFFALGLIVCVFLTFGTANAQTATMKKLAEPLQQVVSGQPTTATSWYKPTASQPFVQVLIQTHTSDTTSLEQAFTMLPKNPSLTPVPVKAISQDTVQFQRFYNLKTLRVVLRSAAMFAAVSIQVKVFY